MAYFPVVGRLNCGSTPVEHEGFWQLDGFGIMAIYKSDWDRFGGKSYVKLFSCTSTENRENFIHSHWIEISNASTEQVIEILPWRFPYTGSVTPSFLCDPVVRAFFIESSQAQTSSIPITRWICVWLFQIHMWSSMLNSQLIYLSAVRVLTSFSSFRVILKITPQC